MRAVRKIGKKSVTFDNEVALKAIITNKRNANDRTQE
jgi:hypothetical protein